MASPSEKQRARDRRAIHRLITEHRINEGFTAPTKCTECGCDPATIIDARAIGGAGPPVEPSPPLPLRKPTRVALEKRIAELEAEIGQLKVDRALRPDDHRTAPTDLGHSVDQLPIIRTYVR